MLSFRNDSLLWYNVPTWAELGLAVPNFGNDQKSQNGDILYLTNVMGRNLQAVMFHPDANLSTPPTINTLRKVHALCIRARDILASRALPEGTPQMESAHNLPSPEIFKVYPCPYFKVRNQWLREWAGYILLATAECMQHTENARPLNVSSHFAGLIGQYIHRVYQRMAVELFHVPVEQARELTFTLTDEQLASYRPSEWFTSTEMIDTVHPFELTPTEDDVKVLTDGIPVSQLPTLAPWPDTAGGASVSNTKSSNAASSFAPPPGP